MATRRRLDLSDPPRLSPATIEGLDALTPEQMDRNAIEDPDNPPLTEEELALVSAMSMVRRARQKTGLSQAKFAHRFRINPARLRDWEQGRFQPDSVALAYLKVIENEPEAVERALARTA